VDRIIPASAVPPRSRAFAGAAQGPRSTVARIVGPTASLGRLARQVVAGSLLVPVVFKRVGRSHSLLDDKQARRSRLLLRDEDSRARADPAPHSPIAPHTSRRSAYVRRRAVEAAGAALRGRRILWRGIAVTTSRVR
jgi:hypothetical protein